MTLMNKFLGAAAALALTSGVALADPAIIYDLGGKFDKSFNEAAFNGAERWKAETGGSYKELEMQSEAQREQALRRLAEAGSNPVVMTGFAFGDVLAKVAPDFPDPPSRKLILLGGLVSGWLGGRLKLETRKGPRISNRTRWIMAFAGGMIMGWGARLARGCTSGQALSGGAVLSAGSWAFMFSIFIGAYALAWFLRRLWLGGEA